MYGLLQQWVTGAISIRGLYAAASLSEGQHTVCYLAITHHVVVLLLLG